MLPRSEARNCGISPAILTKFEIIIVPSSSLSSSPKNSDLKTFLGLFDVEDEGAATIPKSGNWSPISKV